MGGVYTTAVSHRRNGCSCNVISSTTEVELPIIKTNCTVHNYNVGGICSVVVVICNNWVCFTKVGIWLLI